jgi:hypothetical protein
VDAGERMFGSSLRRAMTDGGSRLALKGLGRWAGRLLGLAGAVVVDAIFADKLDAGTLFSQAELDADYDEYLHNQVDEDLEWLMQQSTSSEDPERPPDPADEYLDQLGWR